MLIRANYGVTDAANNGTNSAVAKFRWFSNCHDERRSVHISNSLYAGHQIISLLPPDHNEGDRLFFSKVAFDKALEGEGFSTCPRRLKPKPHFCEIHAGELFAAMSQQYAGLGIGVCHLSRMIQAQHPFGKGIQNGCMIIRRFSFYAYALPAHMCLAPGLTRLLLAYAREAYKAWVLE